MKTVHKILLKILVFYWTVSLIGSWIVLFHLLRKGEVKLNLRLAYELSVHVSVS